MTLMEPGNIFYGEGLLFIRTFFRRIIYLNAPQSTFVKNQSLQRFKNGGSLYCLVHDPGAWRLIFFKESTEKRRSPIFFLKNRGLKCKNTILKLFEFVASIFWKVQTEKCLQN
uniref:Uncharacterized protein n=1 Tax=Cacopsylla melanoneura TaxID=428564 RepID=A0A8D8QTW3_9HEMI